jgi:hypothetical protein
MQILNAEDVSIDFKLNLQEVLKKAKSISLMY